jgi:hypothetical protein
MIRFDKPKCNKQPKKRAGRALRQASAAALLAFLREENEYAFDIPGYRWCEQQTGLLRGQINQALADLSDAAVIELDGATGVVTATLPAAAPAVERN